MYSVDAHIHLADDEYEGRVPHLLNAGLRGGVLAMVANSQDRRTCLRTLRLGEENMEMVYPALGVHPWNATAVDNTEVDEVCRLIEDHASRLTAVGEIGLDRKYTRSGDEWTLQETVFHRMLQAAERTSLPAIIHSRGNIQEVLSTLPNYQVGTVVLHWYSGPKELIPQIAGRGYYITVGPSLLYAKSLQETAAAMPLEFILTETDGPVRYHGPPLHGRETSPELISLVVEKLSDLLKMPLGELYPKLLKNASLAFPRLSPRLGRYVAASAGEHA